MAQKSAAFPVKHQIKQSKHSSAVQSDDSAYFVNLCLKGSQLLLPSYCSCFGKVQMADFFWLFFLDTCFESESESESSDDDEDDEEDEVSCQCFFADFLCFFFFKSESESESSVDDEDDDDDECFFCFFFLELLCLDLEDLY